MRRVWGKRRQNMATIVIVGILWMLIVSWMGVKKVIPFEFAILAQILVGIFVLLAMGIKHQWNREAKN